MSFHRYDIYGGGYSTVGVAYMGGVCSNFQVSAVEESLDYYSMTSTAAHELAHKYVFELFKTCGLIFRILDRCFLNLRTAR